MHTEKEIAKLMDAAMLADCDLGCTACLSDERIASLYNGCGPEWLPAAAREKLTSVLSIFEPAFVIHDVDYSQADGSTYAFTAANDRLEANCLKLADRAYPWYSWRRYSARLAAIEIASLCRRYGWHPYTQAQKKGNP